MFSMTYLRMDIHDICIIVHIPDVNRILNIIINVKRI